jgi:hypothetical protein
MALLDPFAAYNADSNFEAHLVCGLLHDAGIEAAVIEDVSVGVGRGGLARDLHNSTVWIERADIERVRPVLTDYEKRAAARRAADQGTSGVIGPPVEVVCEECGKRSEFPAAQNGSVQNCPHCRAYVDVGGDDAGIEGWDETSGEGEPEP